MNNKGFFLSELMIVASVVLIASLSLYTSATHIIKNNARKERYNSVDSIYRAKNIKDYLFRFNKITDFTNNIDSADDIIEINKANCSDNYFQSLYDSESIKSIWFLKRNFNIVNNNVYKSSSNEMKKFINWIKKNAGTSEYRLIINYTKNGKDYFGTIEVNYDE